MRLEVLDAEGFAAYADEAIAVYAEAMQRPPQMASQRKAMLQQHLRYGGVIAVLAVEDDGRLIGFGYGYPGRSGQWWHDAVAVALGADGADWVADSFEVVELHVRPAYQAQGIGRQLLSTMLDQARQPTALLSTHDRESPARRLYRSLGFVDLLCDYRFPGGVEQFCIMGAPLPVEARSQAG
ncbi:MAG TPA: GNAT family N-acetyltransferase [Mycobacteriales bacterium]|jgi:GNAT superfamily N-acetyltransferase|nr:GNAT family N-acetyltransferase [Mycobacteriales bacterium]